MTEIWTYHCPRKEFPHATHRHNHIVPVSKKSAVSLLNKYHPVAPPFILVKHLEKLVLQDIKNNQPTTQPAWTLTSLHSEPTWSMEDTVFTALHSVFTHLKENNTFIRTLFVLFSSASNKISSMKLIGKLNTLVISTTLFNWIFNFLTKRPDSSFWLSHLLHSSSQQQITPVLCTEAPLVYSVCPWLKHSTQRELHFEVG